MINVLLDTQALSSGHAVRGVGMYTRKLFEHLKNQHSINVIETESNEEKADIVHLPHFDLFQRTLSFKSETPWVITIHDVIPLLFPNNYKVGVRGTVAFLWQKLALKKASAVITDSEASKTDIHQKLGVPLNKISVVYLGVEEKLKPASVEKQQDVLRKYDLPAHYALYVGDINYNKNIPQLIKALKFLPESVHLVCVGRAFYPHPIPEWQWIDTQMALSDVAARVHFINDLGPEAQSELAALYSAATVYVQPSLYEGFGLPVVEAMRCKVPVISARNSSLTEVGGEVVIFSEPEAQAFAKHIEEVLNWSSAKRARVVAEAERWSKQFSWETTAKQTVAVYKQVLTAIAEAARAKQAKKK